MNGWIRALSSSVGKKVIMAITGLALCGFLVVHLAGNMLLFCGSYVDEHGQTVSPYDEYAHKLHSYEGILRVAEAGLALLFLGHIFSAAKTTRQNQQARRQGYTLKQSKLDPSVLPDSVRPFNWMLISGFIVMAFLVLHLVDFTWEARPDYDYTDKAPSVKAVDLLQTNVTFVVYVLGCIAIGFHLVHGFASGFQSLGLHHAVGSKWLKGFSVLFGVVIAAGFASLPIWFWFNKAVGP